MMLCYILVVCLYIISYTCFMFLNVLTQIIQISEEINIITSNQFNYCKILHFIDGQCGTTCPQLPFVVDASDTGRSKSHAKLAASCTQQDQGEFGNEKICLVFILFFYKKYKMYVINEHLPYYLLVSIILEMKNRPDLVRLMFRWLGYLPNM